jgi:hypothetical protein
MCGCLKMLKSKIYRGRTTNSITLRLMMDTRVKMILIAFLTLLKSQDSEILIVPITLISLTLTI